MSVKKKKQAKKLGITSTTNKGKQVSRPSYKKPRPKKHVEAKLPKLGAVPESITAPNEMVEQECNYLSTDDVQLNEILKDLTTASLNEGNDNFHAHLLGLDVEPPITISVELPSGKTEEDVANVINVASSLMKNKYDATIYEIRNIWGPEYKRKLADYKKQSALTGLKTSWQKIPDAEMMVPKKLSWLDKLINYFRE